MGQLWLPGSEIRQRHDGWDMDGGPPRVVHHITYDSLNGDGSRIITLGGVTNYLLDKGYEPHLIIDPFTGEAISCLPADRGGSALRAGNKTGDVCYQIEWLFTPGTVYEGARYGPLTDTPMLGLDLVMALADSWGIPRVSPLPHHQRDSGVWDNEAGHYGHFNVPGNDHTDPECPIEDILAKADSPAQPTKKEDEDMFLIADPGNTGVWITDGIHRTGLDKPSMEFWQNAGVRYLGTCYSEVWARLIYTGQG